MSKSNGEEQTDMNGNEPVPSAASASSAPPAGPSAHAQSNKAVEPPNGVSLLARTNELDQYFAFNDEAREVEFKRHDMPTPWLNYLSNGTFHTMLSHAGGGLSFYKSPQIWRITRYRFFHLPTDRSGPYIYLQDAGTGSYWCPTYEPAFRKPQEWRSSHGMGYTRFEAQADELAAKTVYFVGPYENSLIWNLTLTNNSAEVKELNVYAYAEFGMMEFMRELQWQCYNKHQVSVQYHDKEALIYKYGVENQPKPDETPLVYMMSDAPLAGYDGDREEFIGSYRSESNPAAIEQGGCTGSAILGGDPCGALQVRVRLAPGETRTVNFFLGTAMNEDEIERAIGHSREADFVTRSYAALQENWKRYLGAWSCELPDQDAQRMLNTWNPYQAQRNFLFSRNISYYATGTFRGVGYRDTAQDILAVVPYDPEAAKDKVRLLVGQQYQDGHVNHYFFPNEGWDPVTSIHSDDHLWTALAVWDILAETGDAAFLQESIPFYDGGEAPLYDHLKRAVDFTVSRLGPNGFPLMLRSDWNDQLFRVCREGRGESIWTAMQFGTVLLRMKDLAAASGYPEHAAEYDRLYDEQKSLVNTLGWDGQWFRRAVMDDGRYLGTAEHEEAQIWLNAQTWATLSGMAEADKGQKAMDSVRDILDTELGIKKLHPSITTFPDPADPLTNYNKGTGENGAVFCHANTWAIIAECMLGRGDQAYKYYRQLIPNIAMEQAGIWRYKAEPYVYASNLFGPESDRFGLANVSWLTGTAAWMYVAATQYIMGIKPVLAGLSINPCIPSAWEGFSVTRRFRGCEYEITVKNNSHVCSGVQEIRVDGERLEGTVIPPYPHKQSVKVEVIL